jgi:predicted regulator of Ras-like GTPase activity (Roadblock/LC7/MglB family)
VPEGNVKDVISELARGAAGVWMVTLIDSDSMVLASWQSADNKVSPESLGGFMQIFNSAVAIFKASPLGFSKFEDIIFSTTNIHQIIKPVGETSCFLVVCAPRNVPLGIIRAQCASYAPKLEAAMPGREPLPRKDGTGTIVP